MVNTKQIEQFEKLKVKFLAQSITYSLPVQTAISTTVRVSNRYRFQLGGASLFAFIEDKTP